MASSIKQKSLLNHFGFTLVEAMLAVVILMVLVVGSASANRLATSSIKISQYRSKANDLASEAMGAVTSIKLDNFSNIKLGTFHPYYNGTAWTLVAGSETQNGLTRSITFTPVMRALTCFTMVCDITAQGGIVDVNSFYVETKITWLEGNIPENLTINSLITYWR